MTAAAIEQFRSAMRAAGLPEPEAICDDGKVHRFNTSGKRGDDSGWYVLHTDGIPAGAFGCWRQDVQITWAADTDRRLTQAERDENRRRMEAIRAEREAEEARAHEAAAQDAQRRFDRADRKPVAHPYTRRKGIEPHGARAEADGTLLIPMRDAAGKLWNVERIGADGSKRGLAGGRRSGLYHAIGKPADLLVICEGFATGASIHEATGHAVAVAFNAGNLAPVALALREKYPRMTLILAADDDWKREGNAGMTKATAAAAAVGGLLAVPRFTGDRPKGATDFNDMKQLHGADAVRECFDAACATAANDWPEPLPLTTRLEAEEYPADALPGTIRRAVEEVAGFVKAPLPLVASCALAALSVAAQAHADVKRAEKLEGPSSLFLLTIADSGERKSTCDGFFTAAIREWEREQAEAAKPLLKQYRDELDAWTAEREGLLAAIKEAAKKGKPADKLRADLEGLQELEPDPPRVPRMLLGDETPENLVWTLAKKYPAAAVVCSEAGLIFGSHGMGRDSIMRNLGTLNALWSGERISIGRRTTDSFEVQGARLTVALQVQEPTLRGFFDKSGPLARGTGFLARFLIAWPASTQGARPFTEAPQTWPSLAAFNRRLRQLLDLPAPMDIDGALIPEMLSLTHPAKAAWVEFHDGIEQELRSGGDLYDVRDVASKAADNAARLAALFQLFEHGGGSVSVECMEAARLVVAWHLSESRRFFGELALPEPMADALRLDAWLRGYCADKRTAEVGKNHVRQHGPLRDGARLEAAIAELADARRLRAVKDGRRLTLHVNPALLKG